MLHCAVLGSHAAYHRSIVPPLDLNNSQSGPGRPPGVQERHGNKGISRGSTKQVKILKWSTRGKNLGISALGSTGDPARCATKKYEEKTLEISALSPKKIEHLTLKRLNCLYLPLSEATRLLKDCVFGHLLSASQRYVPNSLDVSDLKFKSTVEAFSITWFLLGVADVTV